MSIPTAIFLDTEVFDGLNYNFKATELRQFIKLCKAKRLTLLLPEPTKDEIERHMKDRAADAEVALKKAMNDIHRKASFLASWDRYPTPPVQDQKSVLALLCRNAWSEFERQLSVKRLGYAGIELKTIMQWYKHVYAPFALGAKRKEFPDAVAVAILDQYARKHSIPIAIVSNDGDMKRSCERFQHFFHFPSLSRLIESFLSESEKVNHYIGLINAHIEEVSLALYEEISMWSIFRHYQRRFKIRKTHVESVAVGSFDIIGLGIQECTIAFQGSFEAIHQVEWEDDDADWSDPVRLAEVNNTYEVSGTVKVKFTDDDKKLKSCDSIEVNETDFELDRLPRLW